MLAIRNILVVYQFLASKHRHLHKSILISIHSNNLHWSRSIAGRQASPRHRSSSIVGRQASLRHWPRSIVGRQASLRHWSRSIAGRQASLIELDRRTPSVAASLIDIDHRTPSFAASLIGVSFNTSYAPAFCLLPFRWKSAIYVTFNKLFCWSVTFKESVKETDEQTLSSYYWKTSFLLTAVRTHFSGIWIKSKTFPQMSLVTQDGGARNLLHA